MSIISRLFKRQSASDGDGLFADVASGEAAKPPKKSRWAERKQKSAKQPKPTSIDAPTVQVIENGEVQAAFGLRWRTLIQAGGKEESQFMASKAKATHYIFRSPLCGYGILPQEAEGQVFPAALLVSKLALGTAIFAVSISKGQYWLAMVRNGQPASTDEIVNADSDHEILARVRSLIAQYEGERITVYSDIRNSGLEPQRNFALPEVFDVVRTDQDRLLRLPRKTNRIPKPLVITAVIGALVLIGQRGYSEYMAYQRRLDKDAHKVVEDSPEDAWKPVVANFVARTPKPDAAAYLLVRKSLDMQPAIIAGWTLVIAKCTAGDLAVDKRRWDCQATYERSRIGETSMQMRERVKQLLPETAVAFPNMQSMVLSWPLIQQANAIDLAKLDKPEDIKLPLESKLQTVLPSLNTATPFKMVAYEFKAPLRKDGKPHPRPQSVPNVLVGKVTLKGPLRSMDALTQQIDVLDWDSLSIYYSKGTDPSQKGIVGSSITSELIGKVYAIK